MSKTIKIAPDVLLILTDEVDSVDLNSVDLYLYEYSDGRKQLLFEDGEFEERTKSFGYFANSLGGFDKVILSPTPNFYPDTHEGSSFHSNSLLSSVLTNPLSSNIDFIKCKLMFSSGFGYDTSTNALQYLSIQYRGNSGILDLVNIFDDYSASNITSSDREVVVDGTIYNTEIEFRLLSIPRLQSLNSADAVEFNTELFGADTPEVIHIEYSVMPIGGIVSFTESTLSFTKLVSDIINTTTTPVSFENNDIAADLANTDATLTFQMIHTRFNLESYLQLQGITVDKIEYEIAYTQYDSASSSLGTIGLTLTNTLNKFGVITYKPTNINASTDHIDFSVAARLTSLDGAVIVKNSTVVISDVTPLFDVEFDVDMEVYNLTDNVTQTINNITNTFDAPTIVQVEKPIYLQKFSASKISIYPTKQVIEIVGVFNDTLENSIEFSRNFESKNKKDADSSVVNNPTKSVVPAFTFLKIGTKLYKNIEGSIFRYKIDEYAHGEKSKMYMILDGDGILITSGEVENIKL
tara:strand:- start:2038 stop:3603 length:1566 start_codon:yes stop_codon:yes gene_type:complete